MMQQMVYRGFIHARPVMHEQSIHRVPRQAAAGAAAAVTRKL